MINKITGAIAAIGLIVFLGEYVRTIKSLPLSIIIIGVAALLVADYLLSFKAHREYKEYVENQEDDDSKD